jgi:uncharacterized membrane protein
MFFLPAILSRYNVYLFLAISCLYIIVTSLLITYGYNKKTLSAGLGIISGIIVAVIIMFVSERLLYITGLSSDLFFLNASSTTNQLDIKSIIFSIIIIASLGAIMDVGISIASAIYELKQHNNNLSFLDLVKAGNNIGKDITGTMVNTLILAFIGSSFINMIMLLSYERNILVAINREDFILELFQPLIGSFGIIVTIPITVLISSFILCNNANIRIGDNNN